MHIRIGICFFFCFVLWSHLNPPKPWGPSLVVLCVWSQSPQCRGVQVCCFAILRSTKQNLMIFTSRNQSKDFNIFSWFGFWKVMSLQALKRFVLEFMYIYIYLFIYNWFFHRTLKLILRKFTLTLIILGCITRGLWVHRNFFLNKISSKCEKYKLKWEYSVTVC